MVAVPSVVLESGVDWITGTASHKSSKRALWDAAGRWARLEEKRGNERRLWGFSGYEGFKCGSVQYGTRHDSTIVRVTGALANEHYKRVIQISDNISRLDLQATVRSSLQPQKIIARDYRSCLKLCRSKRIAPAVALFKSNTGGSTLYLGRRCSERFGRVYDKFSESLHDDYRGCVRYELELKGARAKLSSARLLDSVAPGQFVLGQVQSFFQLRGCQIKLTSGFIQTIVLHRTVTDRTRSLQWISESVRPTIQRLLLQPNAQEVFDCLGINEAVFLKVKKSRRLRAA